MSTEDKLAYEPNVTRVLTTPDEARKYYNKIAKIYDLMAEESEGPMRDKGLKELAVQPGERALEVGFGTGHCIVELAQAVGPTGKVYGVDISDNMVEKTTELVQSKGLADRVELKRADGEKLPFADASLDVVFTSFTLELFDTPVIPQVLAEFRRVLKPGGRVGVVAVSREEKPGLVIKIYEWTHKHFPNMLDCRPIYVRRALEASGFTITHADVQSMWVPVEIVVGRK